jgi:hypothetical protein
MVKERKLMLCGTTWPDSPHDKPCFPYVLLKGRWLSCWGFGVGDQVTVTSPESGVLVMRVTKTHAEFEKQRADIATALKELEKRMKAA